MHEVNELLQYTEWLRNQSDLDSALSEAKREVERIRQQRQRIEWRDAVQQSERGCGHNCSLVDNRNRDRSHRLVPQPGTYTHPGQTLNNQLASRNASTARPIPETPPPLYRYSRSPTAPSMHSRITRSLSADGNISFAERPAQPPRPNPRPSSRFGDPHESDEQTAAPSRPARESSETRRRPPPAQQGPRPYAEPPSTRTAGREWRPVPASPERVQPGSPPRSESLALEARLQQAAANARQHSSQYARASRESRRGSSLNSAQGSRVEVERWG